MKNPKLDIRLEESYITEGSIEVHSFKITLNEKLLDGTFKDYNEMMKAIFEELGEDLSKNPYTVDFEEYYCGDGCCSEDYYVVYINDKLVQKSPQVPFDENILETILIGYGFEVNLTIITEGI